MLVGSKSIGWVFAAYWIYAFFRSVRSAERRRKLENQPHSFRDSLLLLFSGLIVVAILVLPAFFKKLDFGYPRVFGYAVLLIVGGGLTYILNRKHTDVPRS